MTAAWELWVPGRPVPKARPRMTRRGRVYTPKRTLDYEASIAQAAHDAGVPVIDAPIELAMDFYVDGAFIQCWEIDTPTSGPLVGDIDNYSKSLIDGLQKNRYGQSGYGPIPNDRQVVRITADKGSYQ